MVQDLISGAEKRRRRQGKKKQYRYEIRINENIAIGLYKEQYIRLIVKVYYPINRLIYRRSYKQNTSPLRARVSIIPSTKHYTAKVLIVMRRVHTQELACAREL